MSWSVGQINVAKPIWVYPITSTGWRYFDSVNQYLYWTTNSGSGVSIYAADVSNPASVNFYSISSLGQLRGISKYGNYLYAGKFTGSGEIRVVNVTDPTSMSLTGSVATGHAIQALEIDSGLLFYTTDIDNDLYIRTITAPATIPATSTINIGGLDSQGLALRISSSHAFFSNLSGVIGSVDYSTPGSPSLVDTLSLSGANELWYDSNSDHLFCTSTTGTLTVIDSSDPTNLTSVSSESGYRTSAGCVDTVNNQVYLSTTTGLAKCAVADVANWSSANTKIPIFSSMTSLATDNEYIYSVGGGYLVIAHLSIL